MDLVAALISITFMDLILSGDNAVVIALASRNLPSPQRKKAVIWGAAGAVGLRVLLTTVAALLLQIPYMQFFGGVALLWIAIKLLAGEKEDTSKVKEASGFWEAIRIIMIADAIMSLDNVLAVAGIAQGNIPLLLFGLGLSIPLVVFGSQFFIKLMDRFPALIYAGAAILGWTAGAMVAGDGSLGVYLHDYTLAIKISLTVGVIGIGHWLKSRHAVPSAAEAEKVSV
ncbi:MAG: TerC family protein [Sporomusaceae bacterium]|nr:TerC family protein [Sporomusaceae bacterium]